MNPLYTDELAAEICARLASGEPLAVICRSPGMPAVRTVSDWRKANPSFEQAFLAARDGGYDAIAHRARQTARGKGGEDGGDSSGDVQRDKLIIDTDLKLLAKWDPRRYGEKLDLNHGGAVATNLTVSFRSAKKGNGSGEAEACE